MRSAPRGLGRVNKAERTMYGRGFQPLNLQSFALPEPAAFGLGPDLRSGFPLYSLVFQRSKRVLGSLLADLSVDL